MLNAQRGDLSAGSWQPRQCGPTLLNHDFISNIALGIGGGHFEPAGRVSISDDDILLVRMKSMFARGYGGDSCARYC
jgi:hypothetical protein